MLQQSYYIICRQTPIGEIGIVERNGALANLLLPGSSFPGTAERRETPLLEEAFGQLDEWLAGRREQFALPMDPAGTTFMRNVWRLLQEIPYGATASYREIASRGGNPAASRAVGLACRSNPLPIFIPCHRVVCSDGRLGGYLGGLELKRRLIDFERRIIALPDVLSMNSVEKNW